MREMDVPAGAWIAQDASVPDGVLATSVLALSTTPSKRWPGLAGQLKLAAMVFGAELIPIHADALELEQRSTS